MSGCLGLGNIFQGCQGLVVACWLSNIGEQRRSSSLCQRQPVVTKSSSASDVYESHGGHRQGFQMCAKKTKDRSKGRRNMLVFLLEMFVVLFFGNCFAYSWRIKQLFLSVLEDSTSILDLLMFS